jgi:hypothetical protein
MADHHVRRLTLGASLQFTGEADFWHPTGAQLTGNLDEGTRDEIMSLLEQLWRERGLTLIMVSHDTLVARKASGWRSWRTAG